MSFRKIKHVLSSERAHVIKRDFERGENPILDKTDVIMLLKKQLQSSLNIISGRDNVFYQKLLI